MPRAPGSFEFSEKSRLIFAECGEKAPVAANVAVIDLIAVMGYYDIVSMALNVDRYPLPGGATAPFPEPPR